jgi:hypothetical protein
MGWTTSTTPNLPDFQDFIANGLGVPGGALPLDSPYPQYALNQAQNLVLNIPGVAGLDYTIAVYNCAGHILLRVTPDQIGQSFFATARQKFNMLGASSGVIASSSDQSTSNSFATPEGFKNFTTMDLEFFRTPWGRAYLDFNQSFGGISGLT